MGKNLTQQKRGKGSPRYRAPSFRYVGKVEYPSPKKETVNGMVRDLMHCPGHSSPLAKVEYENKEQGFVLAPEGVKVGDSFAMGESVPLKSGNILPLKDIPEGTPIYNLESNVGDGGKFVRSSGTFAKIITKLGKNIIVELPSRKRRTFNENCRATIGVIAGAGRLDKPFLKAGRKYFAMKAKNKMWPIVSGTSMNAVAHPYGGHSSNRHKTSFATSRNAPPGRKVGKIAPRRTGRTKR
jgi:large subunit ribosomal protein L2